jgi:hypothetical protein
MFFSGTPATVVPLVVVIVAVVTIIIGYLLDRTA